MASILVGSRFVEPWKQQIASMSRVANQNQTQPSCFYGRVIQPFVAPTINNQLYHSYSSTAHTLGTNSYVWWEGARSLGL